MWSLGPEAIEGKKPSSLVAVHGISDSIRIDLNGRM